MLAKKHRLSGSKDYERVQSSGLMFQSECFGMAYFDRKDNEPSRFGFVVSTKISKDAVDRNRFKRTMSEAVRMCSTQAKNGYDVVFLAKTTISRKPTSGVMKEVQSSLAQIGII